MRKNFIFLLLVISLFSWQCKTAKSTKSAKSSAAKPTAKITSIKEKIKNCSKKDGLFVMYYDTTNGNAYMQLNDSMFGKEYIYFSYAENGVIDGGNFKGQYRDNSVFRIEKEFNIIKFTKINTHFYHDTANAISKASMANMSESILGFEKIVAEDTAKKIYLIDASALFLSEKLQQIKPTSIPIPGFSQFDLGTLSKDKSRILKIRSYPENTDIVTEYVYDNVSPRMRGGSYITDARSVSVTIQHSFLKMPENNFKPRKDDPRVGYFMQAVTDLTSLNAIPYNDVINRWNLEKKDPNAAISEPIEPITYWIENTTPIEWRETIKEAALLWNKPFEKIGFKNAIRVEIQPDTATWDAGDIRYNVLRWMASPTPPFGGYGPSFVNPRTGQILGADIMLEYVYFANRIKQNATWEAFGINNEENHDADEHDPMKKHFCNASEYMQIQNMFGAAAMSMMVNDTLEANKFLKQAMHYLILHEMGHTLGLMHNMKATYIHTPEQLADAERIKKYQIQGSVMDYPSVNIRKDKTKQTDYFINAPGPYDDWAIDYGYSVAITDAEKEAKRLEEILAKSTQPELIFGNDGDDMRSPGKGIDPRVNIYDMSNNPIVYGTERIELVNELLKELPKKYIKEGESYQGILNTYMILSTEHLNWLNNVSRYIGGVYVDRALAGQEGGTKPFIPVDLKTQKESMKFLSQFAFAPHAFDNHLELAQYMQKQRRGFNQGYTGEDPKIQDRILNIQLNVLSHILNPNVMKRMDNATFYGNEYTTGLMLKDLTDAIFLEDINSNVNIVRQNLQDMYITALIQVAGLSKSKGYDHTSEANALYQLNEIASKLNIAKNTGNIDSKAHKASLIYKIKSALENK